MRVKRLKTRKNKWFCKIVRKQKDENKVAYLKWDVYSKENCIDSVGTCIYCGTGNG